MSDRYDVKTLGKLANDVTKYNATAVGEWHGISATAVAPVAALPTTAAHLVLWNGEAASSGKVYIIHAVGSITTTTAGAAIYLGLAACITAGLVTTKPTGTAATVKPLTGNSAYGGSGALLDTVTIVNDGAWLPVGPGQVNANTATLMQTVHYEVSGRYIVWPGQQFCLATLCNAAGTAVNKPYIFWSEATFTV